MRFSRSGMVTVGSPGVWYPRTAAVSRHVPPPKVPERQGRNECGPEDRQKQQVLDRVEALKRVSRLDRILLGISEINAEPVVHRWKKFDALMTT